MKLRGVSSFSIVLVFIFALGAALVFAADFEPEGPDSLNISKSTRGSEGSGGVAVDAEAGNVTALVISNRVLTQSWQGYYGNITGVIALDDSDGNVFYDWQNPNPKGEIYASNFTSVDWDSLYCINTSINEGNGSNTVDLPFTKANGAVQNVNTSRLEAQFGINSTDVDGLNETFYDYYSDSVGFQVAGNVINIEDDCSLAHPFTNNALDANQWQEVLLSDNDTIVFVGLIRENAQAFDGGDTADFQIMVLEDGHPDDDTVTSTYYFYVELS